MKIRRRFFDSTINFKLITKERLILGIVIGLAATFFIYGFQYLLREAMRLMSKGFDHLPNILSTFERNTFNWFMAAIALIIGNSIGISYIFSGNQGDFGKRNFKNRRIVANQTFLNSYFLFWFAKICIPISFFSMGFTDFNFLPEFMIPMILLVLVLYLETWKTLIIVLGKGRYKYLLLHFSGFVLISFGISKIDFVNYKALDAQELMYSPIVDLPQTYFVNISYFDSYRNVFLNNENKDELLFRYYENYLSDSYTDFLDFKLRHWSPERFSIRLSADKQTKMKFIKDVQQQIVKAGMNTIIYATEAEDEVAKRFSSDGIKVKFNGNKYYENNRGNSNAFFRNTLDVEKDFKPLDTLKIFISDKVVIDNVVVPKNMLARKFKNHINQNTIFQYNFNLDITYQDYINVLSAHLKAVNNLRSENRNVALEMDDESYRFKNITEFLENEQHLCDEFPFRVIEKITD